MKKRELSEKRWEELSSILPGGNGRVIDVDNAWNKVQSRIAMAGTAGTIQPAREHSIKRIMLRAAAAILAISALGSAALYFSDAGFFNTKIVVTALADQRNIRADLPDGSTVFLNRNSRLSYNKNFGSTQRNVSLEGEAFFEIAPIASKPFIIDAGKANVRVVGTSFSVITGSEVEVFVKTGTVLLEDKSGIKSVSLDPGYLGRMSQDKSEKILNSDPNYLAWNTGKLIFKGEKLEVVFRDLRKYFNMDIEAEKSILELPWTSPIYYDSKDKIISLICTSFNLSYTKDGNVYHLSEK